jgi:hypothetical protein
MVQSRLICADQEEHDVRNPRELKQSQDREQLPHLLSKKILQSTGNEIEAVCAENVSLTAINCRSTGPHKDVILIFNVDVIAYRAGRVATLA